MNKAVDLSFGFLIMLWVLPSGTIFGFPIKMLAFAVCFFLFYLASASKKRIIKITDKIIWLLFACVTMCVWMIIAVINDYTKGIFPMIQYVSAFVGMLILADLYFANFSTTNSINKLGKIIYVSCVCFVAFKIILEILFLLKIISYEMIMYFFNNILSAEVMTLQIPFNSVTLCRLSTSNDLIPFTLLGFDLVFRKRSYLNRFITLSVMFFFSLITYSRLIFLQLLVILLCFVFYLFKKYGHQKKSFIRLFLIIIVSLTLISVFLYQNTTFYYTIQNFINSRFDSDAVRISDDARKVQFIYLFNGFKDHFLFGHGFSSYLKECIRSQSNIFSYELEYLSFLYQFGIIGFLIIIGSIVLVLWAVKPIFNPYMFSSISAMVIIETYLLALYYLSNSNTNNKAQ